jgi:hypothetical protein
MAFFEFTDDSLLLGTVREVDTRKVSIHVKTDSDLQKAQVSQLVAINAPTINNWLIGIIAKVVKSVKIDELDRVEEDLELEGAKEEVINTVRLTLVGTTKWRAQTKEYIFSRSLEQVPNIDAKCHILKDKQLEAFMNLLVAAGNTQKSLAVGKYTIDESATAYLDGNKFFQRHAALLGSTGSGKSWTVASILEKAANLSSSNIIVFDLHGEYKKLSYVKQLRVPGPEELGLKNDELLYLPYWLLNAEELQAMFIESSEFTAHNQVMAFQDAVLEEKKSLLKKLNKTKMLNALTIDSPIPFEIEKILQKLKGLNEEMVQGSRGMKQGNFYGQFSRLLTRLRSKINDKRYGFLFHAPESEHNFDSMAKTIEKLMDYTGKKSQIKVIDFSEVPAEILPVIVGLVARIIYQIQFWTDASERHPLAMVCDEAHLYLPKKDGKNPVEQRAIEAFEKIAKEGRKYGVALLIVSQRPSDVSSTILSQCNNVIALRLTNSNDQATVKNLMPESLESLLEVLPIMDIGEALVVGDAVLLPSRIKINEPGEKPLSATIDFWTKWLQKVKKPNFEKAVENMRKQGRGK